MTATVRLTCSTCDDYMLVPDPVTGMLERCPDCLHATAVRCLAHGRSLRNGKCPECRYEAGVAQEQIEQDTLAKTLQGGKPLPLLLTDILDEASR